MLKPSEFSQYLSFLVSTAFNHYELGYRKQMQSLILILTFATDPTNKQ